MKVIRLIILIPSIIVVMFLVELLMDVIVELPGFGFLYNGLNADIYNLIMKSFVSTLAASVSAMYIYPFENKSPSLFIVPIIYVAIFVLLIFNPYEDLGYKDISQEASITGIVIGLVVSWGIYYEKFKLY